MILIVLSESDLHEAMKAVVRRVAYLLVPLSILFIRYYPAWGRSYVGYDQSETTWIGVATNKNTLGVLACIGALFLLWDLINIRSSQRPRSTKCIIFSRVLVLLMCWYILAIANSATSLVCAVVGSAMLIALNVPAVRQRPGRVEIFGLVIILMFATMDFLFDIKELFVTALGRDMTLTTRTVVWPILISYQDSPLLGPGFNTFWAGERLVRLHAEVGAIIQAHNGYLETYLNGGLVGTGLLGVLLVSAYIRIRRKLVFGVPEARIQLVMLLVALIYNNSEASFNKVGLMWLVTLFAIMEYGSRVRRLKYVTTDRSLSPHEQTVAHAA